jgi:HupE / UreJ protein
VKQRRWIVAVFLLLGGAAAHAHKFAPSLLVMSERAANEFSVTWKTPRFSATPVPLEPVLPSVCVALSASRPEVEDTGVTLSWTVRCAQPLRGQTIRVTGLAENQGMALLRIEWANGDIQQGALNATQASFAVPEQAGGWRIALDYLRLGVHHILGGTDHLLFVLGLMLLVSGTRPLIVTITAFTIGHSVTLALASLGVLRYPVALIEFLIAFSIFVIAVELTRSNAGAHALRRRPWLAALGFGLLHGMGFAGALMETGLPEHAIPLALLFFNIGIELGQLLFVAAVLLCGVLWRRIAPDEWAWLRWVPVYAIGIGSAYWCIERAGVVWTGAT